MWLIPGQTCARRLDTRAVSIGLPHYAQDVVALDHIQVVSQRFSDKATGTDSHVIQTILYRAAKATGSDSLAASAVGSRIPKPTPIFFRKSYGGVPPANIQT